MNTKMVATSPFVFASVWHKYFLFSGEDFFNDLNQNYASQIPQGVPETVPLDPGTELNYNSTTGRI